MRCLFQDYDILFVEFRAGEITFRVHEIVICSHEKIFRSHKIVFFYDWNRMVGIYQVLISRESAVTYTTLIFQVVIRNRQIEKK